MLSTPNNIQILMNVRLVLTTVIKSVPTLKAPSPVPVTVDIHCQVMEDHAMVCEYNLKREVFYIKCKNISMLKDVGMTVPKSRETSAIYMQQDRG